MTYSIHGITYNTRHDALTALVAAYVSADGTATIDEIKSALNDPDTPDEMARFLDLELGAGEDPADAEELADHIKTRKADIIMATDPVDADE